jgi:hypothetical protein
MLTQGEVKIAGLGNAALDTAGKFEKLNAGLADMKTETAGAFAELVDATGILGQLADGSAFWADSIGAIGTTLVPLAAAADKALLALNGNVVNLGKAWDVFTDQVLLSNLAQKEATDWSDELRYQTDDLKKSVSNTTDAFEDEGDAVSSVSYISRGMVQANKAWDTSNDQTIEGILKLIKAMDEEKDAADELALSTKELQLEQSIAFSSFARDLEESKQDHSQTLEDIEAEHQENLAELAKRGQSWRKQVDVAGETERLDLLKEKLAIALQQQSEFTEKTKESTRMAKDLQIRSLQEQIAEQETLLQNANDGYLTIQGENVAASVELENERYAEQLRLAQEAYALQQEEQRRHLGTMILQLFDAYVQMNGGATEETLKMRTALAEEYGLMEEGSTAFVEDFLGLLDEWQMGAGLSTSAFISHVTGATEATFGLGAAVRDLPEFKEIKVKVTQEGRVAYQEGDGETGPRITEFAEGGMTRGGVSLVGERGPELVQLPAGSYVHDASETQNIINNSYNLNVQSQAQSQGITQDFNIMRAMAG